MAHSNIPRTRIKPAKPTPDFPLFAHASGRWAKKIKGNFHYFGPWNDPDGALARWEEAKDDLLAGRKPEAAKAEAAAKPTGKAPKARKDFPLFPHASGQWAKKVRGKTRYFGSIADDPDGQKALETWNAEKDDLLAGNAPRHRRTAVTLGELCSAFLELKDDMLTSGELAQRTRDGYQVVTDFLVATFGKNFDVANFRPSDFQELRKKMAKRWSGVKLGNQIQVVRSICKFGYDTELLEKPVRFGLFKKPTAKSLREKRNAKGKQQFTPEQIRALLEHATTNMRAMILLGINGAMGNTECAELPADIIDLKNGWLDYARVKTAVERRIPLWPETVDAIQAVLKERPHGHTLLFIGKHGKDYIGNHKGYRVTQEFDRVAEKAKVEGRTFYDLRRTFQTIGEGSKDAPAVSSIMGHAPKTSDMSSLYRQEINDERLRAVADYVRAWLFPKVKGKR